MTRQKMFNTAYHGLAAQGFRKSIKDDGDCAYRGANNMRCALGYLIPDSVYDPEWDSKSINVYGLVGKNITSEICEENLNFLQEMQNVHDGSASPEDMKKKLGEFAARYRLKIPALPDFAAEAALSRATIAA